MSLRGAPPPVSLPEEPRAWAAPAARQQSHPLTGSARTPSPQACALANSWGGLSCLPPAPCGACCPLLAPAQLLPSFVLPQLPGNYIPSAALMLPGVRVPHWTSRRVPGAGSQPTPHLPSAPSLLPSSQKLFDVCSGGPFPPTWFSCWAQGSLGAGSTLHIHLP